MYAKNVLLRYGYAIEDQEERRTFLDIVGSLTTFTHRNVQQVLGGELSVALKDTAVEHHGALLAQRWVDFANMGEDVFGIGQN